ncbi:MAG: hypothetical protein IT372_03490 [Polyangiaceae bacterium]|nr:hypothetical protein [Polyangiaceae bacterium]
MNLGLKLLTLGLAMAIGALAAGCGTDCETLCDDKKECPGSNRNVDCEALCQDERALAAVSECEESYDDLLDCEASVDDICRPGESCASETIEYSGCIGEYCAAHPDDDACAG